MLDESPLLPVLPASDLQRATAWYAEKMGLEPAMVDDERGTAMYQHAGSMFVVYVSEFAGTNQATAAGFMVGDFDAAVARMRANGVVFEDLDLGDDRTTADGVIERPDGGKAAWFKDSEGNVLAISSMPVGQ